MYSMWDAPALGKEVLDSSLSLQQLLIWVLVVSVFSVIKELRSRQKASLFRGAFIRVWKWLSARSFLSCPCPWLLGLVWREPGGWHCFVPAQASHPHRGCIQPMSGRPFFWISQTCMRWTISENCLAEANACHLTFSNSFTSGVKVGQAV